MPRVSKTQSWVHQQDQRPSSTQTSIEILSNLGELSILEFKNLFAVNSTFPVLAADGYFIIIIVFI